MTYNTAHSNKGFTLIETLVAISILLIAVVGPMSFMGDSLSQIYVARDQAVASNLAQEGIEGVRQIRDSKLLERWIAGTSAAGYVAPATPIWDEPITQNPNCATGCTLEVSPSPALTLCSGACTGVLYRTSTGAFTHISTGNTQTQFSRLMRATIINTNEITVISTVTWRASNGTMKKVEIQEDLFGINN